MGRRRNNGYISKETVSKALCSAREFLVWLNLDITHHAISDLIAGTGQRHKQDDYTIDNQLLVFSNQNPIRSFRLYGTYIKGIFRANRCPLQVSIEHHFATRTPRISEGILKAIYNAQDEERKVIMDFQAFAGERVSCICKKTTIDQIQPYSDKYSIIPIRADQTKVRNNHPCIIPKAIAERILEIAHQTGRNQPFPNHESLWREITKYARTTYGVRLTSHYLRKRFHSIAQKTTMPARAETMPSLVGV